ncbi:hypothetical protein H4I96_05659 [Botrytis cinerea]
MARQTNHQKDIPVTHRRSLEGSKAHGTKSKPKTSKVSKTTSTPKQSREQAKKSVVVKPIPKNEVRKLQQSGKDARSSQLPKHAHRTVSSPQPEDLSFAFQGKISRRSQNHILHVGNVAFEEAYTVLLQKLTEDKTHDRAFLQTISHNAQALSAPLATQKIQVSVQQKGRRISEVVEIGRVQDISDKGVWGEAVNEEEPDQGYLVDMQLLDVEHTARMNVLLEELDEVGNDAIKKMKASEKEIDVKTDQVRQRIVGAMMW